MSKMIVGSPNPKKAKGRARGDDKFIWHTLNTIVGGLFGGGETSYTRQRYIRQILTIKGSSTSYDLGKMEAL